MMNQKVYKRNFVSISEQYLLAALREKMKNQGLNYPQLAERCQVPVSSLKRQLHNNALGIDKITLYASFLNTDLIQLATLAKKLQHRDTGAISSTNNQIFTQFPYLYDFIYKLNSLGYSVEDLQEKYQLSDQSITLYLRALEMMGYLTIVEQTKVKLHPVKRFITIENSPLDRLFAKRFMAYQNAKTVRPNVCTSRFKLTHEQILQVEESLYDQCVAFHNQNSENDKAEMKNIMLSIVEGQAIEMSDDMPEIGGDVLQQISKMQQSS